MIIDSDNRKWWEPSDGYRGWFLEGAEGEPFAIIGSAKRKQYCVVITSNDNDEMVAGPFPDLQAAMTAYLMVLGKRPVIYDRAS